MRGDFHVCFKNRNFNQVPDHNAWESNKKRRKTQMDFSMWFLAWWDFQANFGTSIYSYHLSLSFFLVTAHYFYQAGRRTRQRTMCELNEKRHWMFAWLVFIHKYADDSFGNLNFVDFLPLSHSLSLWLFYAFCNFLPWVYLQTLFCNYFMRWLVAWDFQAVAQNPINVRFYCQYLKHI